MQMNGLGAAVPTRPEFWVVRGMPDAFTPSQAVNLGPKPPYVYQGFFKGYSGYSPLGDYFIMNEFAVKAFTDGLNGIYSQRGKPTTFSTGVALSVNTSPVWAASPDSQWRDFYDYMNQRGVETRTAFSQSGTLVYKTGSVIVATYRDGFGHPQTAYEPISQEILSGLMAGKSVIFYPDPGGVYVKLVNGVPTINGPEPLVFGRPMSSARNFVVLWNSTADHSYSGLVAAAKAAMQKIAASIGESGGGALMPTIGGALSNVVQKVASITTTALAPVQKVASNVVESASYVATLQTDLLTGKTPLTISSVAKTVAAPLGLTTTLGTGGAEVTQKVGNVIGTGAVVGTAIYAAAGGFAAAAPAATTAVTTTAATVSPTTSLIGSIVGGVKTAIGTVGAVEKLVASQKPTQAPSPVAPPPLVPQAATTSTAAPAPLSAMLSNPVTLAAFAALLLT